MNFLATSPKLPIELLPTVVVFKRNYYIAPNVNVYVERLKGDDPLPVFRIPSYTITREGFTIFHEYFDPKKFRFHYKVFREEAVSIKEEGTIPA